MESKVHLGIVSHNEIFREGLCRTLIELGFVVDQVASIDSEVQAQAEETRLIVVVAVEASHGLACCEGIRVRRPKARIALMVDEYDSTSVAKAFQTGAVDGYLIKDIGCKALAQSLRLIAMGEKLLPSRLAINLSEAVVLPEKQWNSDCNGLRFSVREAEILNCLVDGDPNKVISRRLQIADATVKVHIKAILRKLGAKNRTQAAIWAVSHGGACSHLTVQSWRPDTSAEAIPGALPLYA